MKTQCTNVDREVWASIVPSFPDYTYEQSYEYATHQRGLLLFAPESATELIAEGPIK
jgi:hypothetical protein